MVGARASAVSTVDVAKQHLYDLFLHRWGERAAAIDLGRIENAIRH